MQDHCQLTRLLNCIDQSVWLGKICPVGDIESCIHRGASTALENQYGLLLTSESSHFLK